MKIVLSYEQYKILQSLIIAYSKSCVVAGSIYMEDKFQRKWGRLKLDREAVIIELSDEEVKND